MNKNQLFKVILINTLSLLLIFVFPYLATINASKIHLKVIGFTANTYDQVDSSIELDYEFHSIGLDDSLIQDKGNLIYNAMPSYIKSDTLSWQDYLDSEDNGYVYLSDDIKISINFKETSPGIYEYSHLGDINKESNIGKTIVLQGSIYEIDKEKNIARVRVDDMLSTLHLPIDIIDSHDSNEWKDKDIKAEILNGYFGVHILNDLYIESQSIWSYNPSK